MAGPRGINVSSGIGKGEAQVINTPQTDRALWRQLELKRQNQKVEKEKLYEDLAKIDVKGIRTADMPKISKLRDEMLNEYSKTGDVTLSREERKAAKNRLAQIQSRLELEAVRSRTNAETDKLLSMEVLRNRERFGDDIVYQIQENIKRPSDDPNYITDILKFLPEAGDADINSSFDRIQKAALEESDNVKINPSGVQGVYETIREASYNPIVEQSRAQNEFAGDIKIRNSYARKYNLLSEEQRQKIKSPFELYFAEYLNSRKKPKADIGLRSTPITNVNVNNAAPTAQGGLPAIEGGKVVNTFTYNTQGGVSTQPQKVSSVDGLVFKPMTLQIAKSANIRNSETLEPIKEVGVMNISVGDLELVPTYKKGTKLSSGKDVSGLPIPDDKLKNAIDNKAVEYGVITFFNDENNVPHQANAKEIVESAQFLSEAGKEDKAFILDKYSTLRKKADELNSKLGNKKSQSSGVKTAPKTNNTKKGELD